jgi:hypothetical protein
VASNFASRITADRETGTPSECARLHASGSRPVRDAGSSWCRHGILAEPSGMNTAGPTRRRRIWDLGESLHCSIIGTCLTTDEIRRRLRKIGLGAPDATDHALHSLAVVLANRQDVGSKLLNKALDDRHRTAIRRFDAARDIGSLRALWRAATDAGDVPGAYWAVLIRFPRE